AHSNIKFAVGCQLSRLANLSRLGQPTIISNRPGTTEGRTQLVSELEESFDVAFIADAATNRQDEFRPWNVDTTGISRRLPPLVCSRNCNRRSSQLGHCRRAASLLRLEDVGTYRHHDRLFAGEIQLNQHLF